MSPGGSIPRSALSFPEPPPSSPTVTIAVILLVYNLSPLNIVDKPVPPPITTILGPPTWTLFSSTKSSILLSLIVIFIFSLFINEIKDFINSDTDI